jgi:hypothetical protein
LSSFPRMLKSIRRVLAIVQQSRLMVPAVPPTRYCQQDWDSSSQVEFWLPRKYGFPTFSLKFLNVSGANMDSNLRSERHVPKLDVAGSIPVSATNSSKTYGLCAVTRRDVQRANRNLGYISPHSTITAGHPCGSQLLAGRGSTTKGLLTGEADSFGDPDKQAHPVVNSLV